MEYDLSDIEDIEQLDLATTPNSELGGLTPAELKFGTLDFQHFRMPQDIDLTVERFLSSC